MTSHILRALLLFVVDTAVCVGGELLGLFGVRAPLVALGSCRVDIGDNSLEGGLLLLLGRSVDFEEGGLQLVHLGLLEPAELGFQFGADLAVELDDALVGEVADVLEIVLDALKREGEGLFLFGFGESGFPENLGEDCVLADGELVASHLVFGLGLGARGQVEQDLLDAELRVHRDRE
jgi:hypothetical protein